MKAKVVDLPDEPSTPPRKRGADEVGAADGRPAKRLKGSDGAPQINMASPSKKQRLEDDGLLLLEDPNEKVDDEPEMIMID